MSKYVVFHNTGLMCVIAYRGNDLVFVTRLLNAGYSLALIGA